MALGNLKFVMQSEDLTTRIQRKILKIIMQALTDRHRNTRVAEHFNRNRKTNPASGEYRYARRSQKYKERKKRIMSKIGGDAQRPLFFRGDLERSVMGSSRSVVTATKWTWRAVAHRKLPLQQRRELEAVADSERNDDADLAEKMYVRLAQEPWARRKRRRSSN